MMQCARTARCARAAGLGFRHPSWSVPRVVIRASSARGAVAGASAAQLAGAARRRTRGIGSEGFSTQTNARAQS